jgi:hypothetical protein
MSVSSTDNQIIYTGSGTTGPFDFDFRVYETSDLLVQKFEIATEITTDLVETTDYTVTLDGDGTGSVTTVLAVTSSYKLIITRQLELTQEITYVENDKFPAETHEEGLDRCRMIDQNLQEQIDRCVKVPAGSAVNPDDLIQDLREAADDAETAAIAAEAAQTAAELAETNAEAAASTLTYASQAEAEAGTVDNKMMSPLRTAQAIAAQAGGASAVELSFTNSNLSTGVLTVTHNKALAAGYTALVQVVNNSGAVVIPDQINTFAANSFKVDLTSYGTISGTWYCTYIVKG